MWYKNCKRCTRWRPLNDFKPIVHRRGMYGEKLYIRNVCEVCMRRTHTAQAREKRGDEYKEQARKNAEKKRRAEGRPVKEFTGLKDRRSQQRESKRKERRKAGIPARPIGERNKGYYGGQKLR